VIIGPAMIRIGTGSRLTSASQVKADVTPVEVMDVGGTGWIERNVEGSNESTRWVRYGRGFIDVKYGTLWLI